MADYYELLGVPRTASGEEIKRAYRRKARELHPDANPDDTATAERFKEVARAYQVLSDPDQRARYDRFGEAGVGGAGAGPRIEDVFGGGGLNDIFDAFFGGQSPFGGGGRRGPSGPPRGQDLEVVADISFEQAVFGATVPVTLRLPQRCEDCGGSGAGAGTQPVTCADCNGSGQVQRVRQSLLGQMVTSGPCPRCGGLGQVVVTPCPTCRGEGRDHRRAHLPGRRPGGRRQRVDAAARRPRRGRPARRRGRRPVRPPARRARTSATGARATTSSPMCRSRSPRRRSARRSPLPTLDGDEELHRPGRHPAGSRVHAAQPRRAPPAGAWPRRPAGPARRRGADEARRRGGGPAAPAGRASAASSSTRRTRACSRASSRRSRRPAMDERAAPRRRPTCSSPTSPRRCADDATAHHLRRVLRLRDGELVTVTDGAGRWRPCRLSGAGARGRRRHGRRSIRPATPVTDRRGPAEGRAAGVAGAEVHRGRRRPARAARRRAVRRALGRRTGRRGSWSGCGGSPPRRRCSRRRVWLPSVDRSRCRRRRCCRPRSPPSRAAGRWARPTRSWRSAPRAAGRRPSWPPAADRVSLGDTVLRVETAAVVAATLLRATRTALR